jgi:ribA/ribD-fused uncharacterized protein
MKLLVCGGRDFDDVDYAVRLFDRFHKSRPVDVLISGLARGADTIGVEWAKAMNIPVHGFAADWYRDGNAAGPIRNQKMLDVGKPDVVMALPGGKGTSHMVGIAENAGVECIVYQSRLFSRARDPEWGWCSNFWPQPQTDQETGLVYKTNEHYYQCEKTTNPEMREWIFTSPDAMTAKQRGNDYNKFELRPDWNTYKLEAMRKGLLMKFHPDGELAQKLRDTGDLYLVEYAPWGDSFWGINKYHAGSNWLGRLLMETRQTLGN